MQLLKRPWQDYADFSLRLLLWGFFVYAGMALVERVPITGVGQWFFWPIAAFIWWFFVVREVRLTRAATTSARKLRGSVTIRLKLREGEHGSHGERKKIHTFTDRLDSFLRERNLGDYDGDEFGGGECLVFMYSDDPKKLYEELRPMLLDSGIAGKAVIEIDGAPGTDLRERVAL